MPPAPGIIARPVSGSAKKASFVAILMSVHRESSQPPPSAAPSTTEIVGTYIFSR